jgi:Legionella pneumophila major outer membrane protein precursor
MTILRLIPIALIFFSSLISVEKQWRYRKGAEKQRPCRTSAVGFIEGAYLYWKTHLSCVESDFGTSHIAYNDTGSTTIISTKEFNRDPKFQWESGFRLAGGVPFPCSHLEFYADWTHFKNKGTTKSHGKDAIVNKGFCKVSLNQIDAVLAYRHGSDSANVKPFIGVRGAFINHSVDAKITSSITVFPHTEATETRHLDDRQRFKGAGPILGLSGDCEFARGFGIYGQAGFGLLYANYQVDFNDSNSFTAPYSKELTMIDHQHLHRFNINLDLALGFFGYARIGKTGKIGLKIGCEYDGYFNQSYLSVNRGDLSFFGGMASLVFAF